MLPKLIPAFLRLPFFLLLIVSAATALSSSSAADSRDFRLGTPVERKTPTGTSYRFFSDLPFPGAKGNQFLDLYLPTSPSPSSKGRPAVLIMHGGGWAIFNKASPREVTFANFMVDQGYAAVSLDYTLTKFEGKPMASKRISGSWPENIADCKSALRWMKAHASALGIDPSRIAVMGGSAGAHLALLTGLSSASEELNKLGGNTSEENSVCCIIDFYGIPDVRRWGGKEFIDVSKAQDPHAWELASPVTHLNKDSPPILIVHGAADKTVNLDLSRDFDAILTQRGLPHEFVIVQDGVHSFDLQPQQQDLRPVVGNFLRKYLLAP